MLEIVPLPAAFLLFVARATPTHVALAKALTQPQLRRLPT
jgi:hypothetical protein